MDATEAAAGAWGGQRQMSVIGKKKEASTLGCMGALRTGEHGWKFQEKSAATINKPQQLNDEAYWTGITVLQYCNCVVQSRYVERRKVHTDTVAMDH